MRFLKGKISERIQLRPSISQFKDLGEEVQFLAFGHPLLESIIDYCRDKSCRFGGRAVIKGTGKFDKDGILFNFLLAFDDATGKTINEDILPIFVTLNNAINFPASRLVAEFNNEIRDASSCDVDKFLPKIEGLHHNAYSAALQKAKDLCTSVQVRKSREIKIKREDAKKFFERRTKEEEERLKDYRLRQSLGEDMAIAIRGSERRIEDLRDEFKKVLDRFEEEELVIERNPELFSVAIIIAKGKS